MNNDNLPVPKALVIFICSLLLLWPGHVMGQQFYGQSLEKTIGSAIVKAYPSSVRMWGFDTVSKQQMSAQFSGVVVSKEGYILTAAHVTIPGKTYQVTFPDGKTAIAMALGKIEFTADHTIPDVAMMKIITPGNWPYAEMGSSAGLKTYEPCISIAYPESLNQPKPTVRFGYISKVINERGFIQSTCMMEPGDSGGPLFDYMGRVIGLHSAIQVAEDLNYEVPVDLYQKYRSALLMPKVYNALPDSTVNFKGSLLHGQVFAIPSLKNKDNNFAVIASKLKQNSLTLISYTQQRQQRATATLFSLRGLTLKKPLTNYSMVISKSSLVGASPMLIWNNGRKVKANIIARDQQNDLVLLQPMLEIKGGIELAKTRSNPEPVQPGPFLISVQPDTVSTVSMLSSNLFSLPKITSRGFFGAAIAYGHAPFLLTVVQPGSPAEEAGLKTGDEVLRINDVKMEKAEDYGSELQKHWPGDTLQLKIKRATLTYVKRIVLGHVPQPRINHPVELFAGGKSLRRDGFDSVFSHDAIIKPERCGGPVFDLNGRFYGINIARFSRANCIAIPAATLYRFMEVYFSDR